MRKLSSLLFACLLALRSAGAAEALADETNEAKSLPEVATVLAKNKSTFALEGSARSPFWPIGWKPASASANGPAPRMSAAISPSAFVVTSITVEQGGRYAIVNGKVMSEGQVFGLQVGNQIHQITVKAIQDGQVILAQQNEEFRVPLRRR